jgi:hypothetical protein
MTIINYKNEQLILYSEEEERKVHWKLAFILSWTPPHH